MLHIDKKKYVDPFNYKNYNFITKNAQDLKEGWIKYISNSINRNKNKILINSYLHDIKKSIAIEFSIFEYSLVYCKDNNYSIEIIPDIYNDKFCSVIENIKTNNKINNNTFKKTILEGQINLKYIAFLSPYQVCPEKWAACISKIKTEEDRENNIEYSDIYKCKKCGESKSKVTQKQTRCADEPPTTFVKCLVCGNAFKFC